MLLGLHYKDSIKEYTFEYYPYDNTNNLRTNGHYTISDKIITKYSEEDFVVLIMFYICIFCLLYTVP